MSRKKELYNLISEASCGDNESLTKLVEENMGLVHNIVKKMCTKNTEYDDLVQIGAIGLIKAIKNFDVSFDVAFSTYAVPMIIGEIRRYIRDNTSLIKISRSYKTLAMQAYKVRESLSGILGREPTVAEIAESVGVDKSELAAALEATTPPESIYKACDENEKILLIDKISGGKNNENAIVDNIALSETIKKLSEREQKIIDLRYFKDKKQTEIAKILGISQVQVSRLEKNILIKMRSAFI